MKVAGVQLDMAWEDKETNFAKVRDLLASSKVEPGSLILLPEMFATGYSMNVEDIHEAHGGPTEQFLKEIAKKHHSHVIGGIVAKAEDGRGLNQALVINPHGELTNRYSKLHPFSYAGETNYYTSGQTIETVDTDEFHITPFICYDLRFPEIFRHAVQRGANCFAVIACWPAAREEHWLALLKARAIENVSYVIGVNRFGSDPKLTYSGRSQVISPKGEILFDAGSEETVFTFDIELSPLNEFRAHFPVLNDIREEYRMK